MWLIQVFRDGGTMMYFILLTGFVTVTIVIERLLFFRKNRENVDELMFEVRTHISNNNLPSALEACSVRQSPPSRVLKDCLLIHQEGEENLEKTVDESILKEIPRLQQYVGWLGICSNIAPLLGLTGTVTGLVGCFKIISMSGSTVNPSQLAGGIYEALYTTVFGLLVGIPSFIAYEYINMQVSRTVSDMEKSSVELLNILSRRKTDE